MSSKVESKRSNIQSPSVCAVPTQMCMCWVLAIQRWVKPASCSWRGCMNPSSTIQGRGPSILCWKHRGGVLET